MRQLIHSSKLPLLGLLVVSTLASTPARAGSCAQPKYSCVVPDQCSPMGEVFAHTQSCKKTDPKLICCKVGFVQKSVAPKKSSSEGMPTLDDFLDETGNFYLNFKGLLSNLHFLSDKSATLFNLPGTVKASQLLAYMLADDQTKYTSEFSATSWDTLVAIGDSVVVVAGPGKLDTKKANVTPRSNVAPFYTHPTYPYEQFGKEIESIPLQAVLDVLTGKAMKLIPGNPEGDYKAKVAVVAALFSEPMRKPSFIRKFALLIPKLIKLQTKPEEKRTLLDCLKGKKAKLQTQFRVQVKNRLVEEPGSVSMVSVEQQLTATLGGLFTANPMCQKGSTSFSEDPGGPLDEYFKCWDRIGHDEITLDDLVTEPNDLETIRADSASIACTVLDVQTTEEASSMTLECKSPIPDRSHLKVYFTSSGGEFLSNVAVTAESPTKIVLLSENGFSVKIGEEIALSIVD